MDQIKIGRFIAECRKKKNLTQMQLAEKLNITDRAISKWENGKGMPDSSIMLDLCKELQISVNELLSGEVLEMNSYNKKLEQNLIDIVKQKEESDKRILINNGNCNGNCKYNNFFYISNDCISYRNARLG